MRTVGKQLPEAKVKYRRDRLVVKVLRIFLVWMVIPSANQTYSYGANSKEEGGIVASLSKLSRVILPKNEVNGVNTLTQAMVNDAHTIYVIQDDFVLSEDISIPADCVLKFEGGSIFGKSITFHGTLIESINNNAFRDVELYGSIGNAELNADWFIDNDKDCTIQLQGLINLLETSNGGTIKFGNHVYNLGFLAVYSKISLVGQGQGSTIIKSYRTPVNNEAIITIAPTATLVNIEKLSIVGNNRINGIGTSVAVSDFETRSDYWFQENENNDPIQRRLAYKNLHVRNVYVGHCNNGLVISNIGIRVTVDDCDIKYCASNGIVNRGNDNFFSKIYIEHCGLSGFVEEGSNSKLSDIKSIFNGDNDPVNSYAFDCNSDLLVNCESQDNACSGYNLRNKNMLVNCYSNRDAIGNTVSPSYRASHKLVGFRISGENNIAKACKVTSYIASTYWKPYEEIGNNNILEISVDGTNDFYMNPVDEDREWSTDFGTFDAIHKSDEGIYPSSLPSNMYKAELLPTKFVVVADFVTDGSSLRMIEGNALDIFDIDESLFIRLSYNENSKSLTASVYNAGYPSEELMITTEPFSHTMPIRLSYIHDGKKGTLALCYCRSSNSRFTQIKSSKTFSFSSNYVARCSIFKNYNVSQGDTGHTYMKRFLIGSGMADDVSIAHVNTPVRCEKVYFSFDYRNNSDIESGILNTIGTSANRPGRAYVGFQYYDTSISKPIWWNGEHWVFSDGTVVQ